MIVNRGGGTFSDEAAGRLQGLFAAHGVEADVRLVAPESLSDAFADAAAAHGLDAVIAAGGDGTVHEVGNGLLRAGRPGVVFGVWPVEIGRASCRERV